MTWTLLILTMAGDVEVSRLALSPGYETRWACEADVPIVADNVAVLTEGQHIEMVCDGPPVPRVKPDFDGIGDAIRQLHEAWCDDPRGELADRSCHASN